MPSKKNKKRGKSKRSKKSGSSKSKSGTGCCTKCLYLGIILIGILAIILTQHSAFLFTVNLLFRFLNMLDSTPFDKTYNAYAGTYAEEFFQPLTASQVSAAPKSGIKPKSGKIPSAFNNGILLRIGSNQYYPTRTNIHVWEGDGMVHAFKFSSNDNTVTVNSAFMETPKLQTEMQWKQGIYQAGTEDLFMALNKDPLIMEPTKFQRAVKMAKFFLGRLVDGHQLSPFSKYKVVGKGDDSKHYFLCANTDTLAWNNKFYATCEGSVFFEFDLDKTSMEMKSVGFTPINDSWTGFPFIAHPRIDRFNNDNLLVVGHDVERGPMLGVGAFDTNGNLLNQMEVELQHTQEVHDMSQTEDYMIIFDYNAWFGQDLIMEHGRFARFEHNISSRIGLIEKTGFNAGKGEVQWFNVEPCIVFHMANAWQDGDEVTLIGGRMNKFDFDGILHFDVVNNRKNGYNVPRIYEWRLNTKTGKVKERVISDEYRDVEMPLIHPLYEGKKAKYIWFNLIDYTDDGFGASSYGIIKYDVENEKVVGRIEYDLDGNKGSYQAVFVPNESKDINKVKSEDDGYLVNIIWNKKTKKSNIQIFDARTMSSKPVTHVELPYRIPGGFHSRFVIP